MSDREFRLAVLGDLHGNMPATLATLAAIDAAGVDAVVCTGDLVGYGAAPNEVVAAIRARGISTVMGNYDDGVGFGRDTCGCAYKDAGEQERGQASLRWTQAAASADTAAWLRGLPFDHRLEAAGRRIRIVHGSPRRFDEYLFEDRDPASLARIAAAAGCDVLVFGHTHRPWARVVGDTLLVNAGSAGKPKDGDPRACWALLTVAGGGEPAVEFRRVAYDVAAAAAAIRAADGLPDHFARDLETGGAAAG